MQSSSSIQQVISNIFGISSPYLAASGHILCCKHGSIWAAFVSVRLDIHSSSDPAQCFLARKIGHMHECVVERCKDMGNSKNCLSLTCCRAKADIQSSMTSSSLTVRCPARTYLSASLWIVSVVCLQLTENTCFHPTSLPNCL